MAKSSTAGSISAVSYSPSSSLSSSPALRFLGHLTVPEKSSDLNNGGIEEFHESDVFWSSSSDVSDIPSPSNVSSSPPIHRQYNSGLYAALSDDQHPLVRRKHAMSPSQSAATAARTIPPVALRRSSEHSVGYHQSAPVNVPVWPKNKTNNYLGQFDEVVDNVVEEEDEGEMVPPHEIVARSYVTFSVFEGAGRTLKGRDLCRVRNAVFQKTDIQAFGYSMRRYAKMKGMVAADVDLCENGIMMEHLVLDA
ncbi:Senescence regulator [Cynara cardunculus var. scolymus]|uniref:Senescence regulator n=1 Tax=Cynara cardunculus var. scolymus TaxID=59895 RepID=A0A103YEI7_CYNCS|nr:Senescence regulator [Cynara cardunculus var. scolymus]